MTTQTKTTWRKVKLGEILEITSSKRIFMSDYVSKGVPFYRGKEIIEKYNRANEVSTPLYISEEKFLEIKQKFGAPKENDILLSSVGTLGIPYSVKSSDRFYFKDGNLTWFCNFSDNIYPKFIYYWLISPIGKHSILASSIGSSQQALTIDGLKKIEIDLPIIDEQKRIAEILSSFDDKIELNNKIIKNLEEMAAAIFKEWFIENQKSKIKNQKLGEIKDIIDIISGFPFSSKLYSLSKDALGVVTIKNVQDGNFVRNFDSFIKKETLPDKFNHDCYLVDGDILLSLTGNVGRVCFVYGGEYLLNQRVAKLKPKNRKDLTFCYFLFRQLTMQSHLINMAKGSAQPNLSPVETGKIELRIPPREILDKFSELASPIYQRLIKNANENQKLSALRDLLLPKLMSGKIRV